MKRKDWLTMPDHVFPMERQAISFDTVEPLHTFGREGAAFFSSGPALASVALPKSSEQTAPSPAE